MTAKTATKTPAFQIVRDAIAASDWTLRFFCPSYTIYLSPEGDREIMVWFFQSSGNLEGARLVTEADGEIIAEVKRNGLATVLGWIA